MRPRCTALLKNPFDRFELGRGVSAWIYAFSNRELLPIPHITTASPEVAIQVEGEWVVEVFGAEPFVAERGDVFTVPGGVRHTYRFRTALWPGLQVGFALPATPPSWRAPKLQSPQWIDLAREVLAFRAGLSSVSADHLADRVLSLSQADRVDRAPSAAVRARAAIEDTFANPLYLEHLADTVGLHPKALARVFVREVGVTPIRFRTELRLQHAIRLLWSQRELSIERIAQDLGFEDKRSLHRLCLATFGLTPAQLGRRPAGLRAA